MMREPTCVSCHLRRSVGSMFAFISFPAIPLMPSSLEGGQKKQKKARQLSGFLLKERRKERERVAQESITSRVMR